MKTIILLASIVFIFAFFVECNNKMYQKSTSQKMLDTINNDDGQVAIKSQALVDVITSYISDVNIKSNSGRLPIYVITFHHDKKRKYLIVSGELALPVFLNVPMNKGIVLKGICFIDKNPILIYDNADVISYNFYDPYELNIDTVPYFKERYASIDVRDNIDYSKWVYYMQPHNELKLKEKTEMVIMK